MHGFSLPDYLARIGLPSLPGGAEGIAALQEAQLRAIPFENIDPLLGRIPDIAVPAVAAKIIAGGRGGYCFELNRLLGAALAAAGHEPRAVLARVRMGQPEGGGRSHFAFVVETDGRRLLVDAGFGGPGPLAPLDLGRSGPQTMAGGTYRVRPDAEETVVEKETPEGWFALYGFDLVPVREADLVVSNHFTATAPSMPFPGNLMVAGWSGDTRIGLFNRALTLTGATGTENAVLASRAELSDILVGTLRLPLDDATLDALWSRLPA